MLSKYGAIKARKTLQNAITDAIDTLLNDGRVYKATRYLQPNLIVRATYAQKPVQGGNFSVILTAGKPNSKEHEFVKQCKKAKEPFPVKKIQIKLFPVKRTSK